MISFRGISAAARSRIQGQPGASGRPLRCLPHHGRQAANHVTPGGRIWATGIIYAIGRVNFLADPSQQPHLRTDELSDLLGVKQTTMTNKGRLIADTLRIGLMDPEFSRRDIVDKNPMTWLLQVDGFLVDARGLPPELQTEAWRRGLIPYVPDQIPDDQADRTSM